MRQQNRFKLLVNSYVIGIIITIAIALVIVFTQLIPPISILIVGLIHLGLLSYLGWGLSKPYLLISAGDRIQTAGYLHTLIGFITALSLLQNDQFEIGQLAIPLSSALITSLVGWLVGGEISAKGEADNPSLQEATDEIVNSLQQYSQKIREIETQNINLYKRNLSSMKQAYDATIQKLNDASQSHLNNLVTAHQDHFNKLCDLYDQENQKLDKLYIEVEKNSKALSGAFSNIETKLTQGAGGLQQGFEQVIVVLNQQNQALLNSLDKYKIASGEVEQSAQNLSTSLRRLKQEGVDASIAIESISKSAQIASNEIQKWATETTNSVNLINQLITELQQLANYISTRGGRNP